MRSSKLLNDRANCNVRYAKSDRPATPAADGPAPDISVRDGITAVILSHENGDINT
jgi:hypothetical protein